MNYVFQVREWTIDFYIHLEKELTNKDKNVSILWLSMTKAPFNELKKLNKKVYYLPKLFETYSVDRNDSNVQKLDNFIFEKYGYGIQFLFEMERFKPGAYENNKFINGHVNTLMEIFPKKAKMISLTCDHFIFFISAYVNKLKQGENYFIQPIGFPQNAQVILNNPWDLHHFRAKPLTAKPLNEYIESLDLDPKVSIHYMKPKNLIPLKHSIIKRVKDLTINKTKDSIFTYLEPKTDNIIPSRILQKRKINYKFDYLQETDIKELVNNCNLFYFPLQFEPEMSILAYSPWYKDQLEVIRLISQSLKSGDFLLLKENPKMIGKRARKFYDYISSFKNVKWADPDMNSRQIIRNSFKVISITGTATIEAACLGINSLIFGRPPFRDLLVERPVEEQPLHNLIKILYKEYSKEEIIENVHKKWSEFSKSLFFGDFTPTIIGNKLSINNYDEHSQAFSNEVLLETNSSQIK